MIWALSWDGEITGAEVGANAGDLAGDCFVLSNSIEVIRLGPDDDACTEPCPDPGTGNTDICVGNTEVWNTETCAYDVAVVQVLGCTDPAYTEFNAAANCDDGSCVTLVGGIVGCTNPDACNYLASATVDGPCSFPGDPCGIGGTWNDDCDCPDTQCEGEYGTQVATIPDLLVEPFGTSEPWEFEGQTTGAGFIFGYILSTNLDCNNNVTAYNVVGFNTTGMFDFSSPELTFDGGGIGPGCYGPNSGLYNVHPISFQGTQAELESWLAIYNTLEEFDNAIDNGVFCANFPTLGDSQDGQYSLFILDEPCDPSAGTISTNNSGFYCAGSNNTITAMSSGFNNTANYTQLYVLTGSSVFTIYDVNTSGSFTTPGPGSYTIHALNVDSDEAASINLSDLIGLNALDVIGTLECYDLVTSSNFFTVLNPISVNLSDYDCNEESGVATVTVSITGGYPEALGAGNYQASGDLSGTIAYGSPYVIDFSDNTNISISASDDLGCSGTGGQNYPACTKTAVELLDFDGRVEEAGNNLFWATATEENSAYFMVQRSIDGVNFQDIAKVDAAGNSNVMINYSLMDDQAPAGTSIYRLEMVDFDGSTEYSNTVSLDRRAESFGIISVGPVPANNNINIVFNSNSELETALEVIDATGKLIDLVKVESTIGLNKVVLDVNSYASGVYFINVTNGTNVAVEKFMKD